MLIAGETIRQPDGERALRGKHVAGVVVAGSIADDAHALATRLAREMSCTLDSMADVVDGASLRRAIKDLSDRYRGETIAVIASADMIANVLGIASPTTAPVTLAIDAEGWTIVAPA